jgi:hypothetical protein
MFYSRPVHCLCPTIPLTGQTVPVSVHVIFLHCRDFFHENLFFRPGKPAGKGSRLSWLSACMQDEIQIRLTFWPCSFLTSFEKKR